LRRDLELSKSLERQLLFTFQTGSTTLFGRFDGDGRGGDSENLVSAFQALTSFAESFLKIGSLGGGVGGLIILI
jgi:hypothetical protein